MGQGGNIAGSIICSIIALLFIPPLFGGIAIYLGHKVKEEDVGNGNALMAVGIICMILGLLFAFILVFSM